MADTATDNSEPTQGQPAGAQPDQPAGAPSGAPATDNPNLGTPAAAPAAIENLSLEELDALQESAAKGEAQGSTAQNVEPAPDAVEPEAQPAGDNPQPEAAPEPEGDPEAGADEPKAKDAPAKRDLRLRLNTLPDVEQEAIQLRRDLLAQGQDIPLAECLTRTQAKYAPAAKSDEAEGAQATADPVAELEEEVAELAKKLDEAGANEGLFSAEIARLTREHSEKVAELKIAQREQAVANQEAEKSAKQTFLEARAASRAKAIEDYPEADKPDSALRLRINSLLVEMQDPAHPDHALLSTRNAPLLVAKLAADELGISARPKLKVLPDAPAHTDAPKVAPASGARRTIAPTQIITEAQVLANLDKMGLDELDRLQGGAPSFYIR